MSSLARRLACSAAMTALLIGSQPAFAQAGPEASILAPANIAGGLLRAGVSYARMVADIRYGALEVDARRGAIVLRDLQIQGIGDQARCQITLGQAQQMGRVLGLIAPGQAAQDHLGRRWTAPPEQAPAEIESGHASSLRGDAGGCCGRVAIGSSHMAVAAM